MGAPAASASFAAYAGKSGESTPSALSGRKVGSTFVSKLSSAASSLCQRRSSAGSSVVQSARMLKAEISERAEPAGLCSFAFAQSHAACAVDASSSSPKPK